MTATSLHTAAYAWAEARNTQTLRSFLVTRQAHAVRREEVARVLAARKVLRERGEC